MILTLIVAVADNGVIGADGRLPWRLPADLRHFKAATMGKPVLMGRRTWESLGRPLPGRRNVVVSRRSDWQPAGAEVFPSPDAALEAVAGEPEVMVIGGAELYAALLPRAHRIALTRVHAKPEGDTTFPGLGPEWRETSREHRPADAENPHELDFILLVRAVDSEHTSGVVV